MERTPSMAGMNDRLIRAWILQWQRDALSKQLHCAPQDVISDAAIRRGAKDYVFPKDTPARPEMERLLRHFRRERMHENSQEEI